MILLRLYDSIYVWICLCSYILSTSLDDNCALYVTNWPILKHAFLTLLSHAYAVVKLRNKIESTIEISIDAIWLILTNG